MRITKEFTDFYIKEYDVRIRLLVGQIKAAEGIVNNCWNQLELCKWQLEAVKEALKEVESRK